MKTNRKRHFLQSATGKVSGESEFQTCFSGGFYLQERQYPSNPPLRQERYLSKKNPYKISGAPEVRYLDRHSRGSGLPVSKLRQAGKTGSITASYDTALPGQIPREGFPFFYKDNAPAGADAGGETDFFNKDDVSGAEITIVGIEPHPEDKKRGAYERVKLSRLPG